MTPPPRKAFCARVRGIVQGVGFRYATVHEARRLGLTGFVRNVSDGSVEVAAEGAEEDAAALLAWLHRGPAGAVVRDVAVEERPCLGQYDRFTVEF